MISPRVPLRVGLIASTVQKIAEKRYYSLQFWGIRGMSA